MFKVGDRVLCLHTFTQLNKGEKGPIRGKIYTIRDCNLPGRENHAKLYCRLEEIVNVSRYHQGEYSEIRFLQERFRKIDDDYELSDMYVSVEENGEVEIGEYDLTFVPFRANPIDV